MAYDIDVRDVSAQPAATIRVKAAPEKLGETYGELLPEIYAWLEKKGHAAAGAPFGIYHGMTDVFDVEIGIPVTKELSQGDGRIKPSRLPGGHVAVATHVGAYDKLGDAHDAIAHWCEPNGFKPSGLSWESYVNDPGALVVGQFDSKQ